MSAYWKMLFVSGLMLMLSSCSTTTVDDYANNQPRLDLQTFFNGQLSAHGVLKDRSGKVTRYFNASINAYWKDFASYPFKSHDAWFITEDIRWGYLPASTDINALVDKVNREDLWRAAATTLNIPTAEIPTSTSRGVEKFFDGKVFDPANPKAYLDSLAIKTLA